MKEVIENYYDLSILGFIKVNDYVYKIKSDQYYYLKFVSDDTLNHIVDYIESLHLKCFVDILKNKDNQILTSYQDYYFYLMEALDESQDELKEIKMKTYFETLSYLHYHSCYYLKVNQEYFKKIYHDINHIIEERTQYYDDIMKSCEQKVYRSPSQWLFVLNYYRIMNSLYTAKMYLKKFMDLVVHVSSLRVCLVYKNFDYQHISLKNRKLLSIDHMSIDIPIYDIYDIYSKLPDILFDLDCLSDYYLKTMVLNDYEKVLLCTLLNVVPVIYLEDDEISNIIKISRLLYYIDSICTLSSKLDIQISHENK
jgi:hypothetical protein